MGFETSGQRKGQPTSMENPGQPLSRLGQSPNFPMFAPFALSRWHRLPTSEKDQDGRPLSWSFSVSKRKTWAYYILYLCQEHPLPYDRIVHQIFQNHIILLTKFYTHVILQSNKPGKAAVLKEHFPCGTAQRHLMSDHLSYNLHIYAELPGRMASGKSYGGVWGNAEAIENYVPL